MAKRPKIIYPSYHPRNWNAWLTIAALQLWSALPWRLQWWIAKAIGCLIYYVFTRRRHVVDVNLSLCFPEKSESERRAMIKEVLFNNALGLVETANAYRKPVSQWAYQHQIHGQDILQAAIDQRRGVLLIGAHFSHLDLGGALLSLTCEPSVIYRPNNNPVLDRHILKGRQKILKQVIDRNNMRAMVKALKQQQVVWYPPDQDYGRKHSVYAPFFGVNAATLTSTSRLVAFNNSPVVIMSCYRDDRERCYHLEFFPAPDGFPSGDDVTDATLINHALEQCIRKAPTQYMWTHRRFKSQPDAGKGDLYR